MQVTDVLLVLVFGATGGADLHYHSGHPQHHDRHHHSHHPHHQQHLHHRQHSRRPRRHDLNDSFCRDATTLLSEDEKMKCCQSSSGTLAFRREGGGHRPLRVDRKQPRLSPGRRGEEGVVHPLCPALETLLEIVGYVSANGTALRLQHTERACGPPRDSDAACASASSAPGAPGRPARALRLRYLRDCREAREAREAAGPCAAREAPTYTCRTETARDYVVAPDVFVCGAVVCQALRCS